MVKTDWKDAFQVAVETGSAAAFEALVESLPVGAFSSNSADAGDGAGANTGVAFLRANSNFSRQDLLHLLVLTCQTTFLTPAKIPAVWDTISAAWLKNQPESLPQLIVEPEGSFPPALWQLFWQGVTIFTTNRVIEQLMAYRQALAEEVEEAYTVATFTSRGVEETLRNHYLRPTSLKLEDLAVYSPGTLGYGFYHQLADNHLNLDFIENRQENPSRNAEANYIGLRLYQTHDIWHVLTGYGISGLEELGLQAFQMAQVVTPSPALLLTLQIARNIVNQLLLGRANFLRPIFEGWQFGRQTPPLIPVRWEELWSLPLNEVRQQYGIVALNQ